jgi:hypothetical protein
MAHFLRLAAATTRIRVAATIPATTVRQLVHTEGSPFPPVVPPGVRHELNRINDDCNGRHRELAADLAKLHGKVMEDYSAAVIQQGDSYPRIKTVAWRVCASVLFFGAATSFVDVTRKMISALVKEAQVELEAELESRVAEKIGAVRAEAFEAGRRSAFLESRSSRPWPRRRGEEGARR